MIKIKKIVLVLCLYFPLLNAISMVYNFRVAQVTKRPIFHHQKRDPYTIISLIFNEHEKKYSGNTENFTGALGAFIYDFEHFYIRGDFAFANILEKYCKQTLFQQVESDDFLLTVGRNFIINEHSLLTFSGLFGVPTHKNLRLQHVDFGYGTVGTGIQADAAYKLNDHHTFFGGTRYIYFFKRNAQDDLCNNYIFSIGNVADILIAYEHHWNKHSLELGFTERWQFGVFVCPNFEDIMTTTDYSRNYFYAVYKYKFKIEDIANRLLFEVAYSFDNSKEHTRNKYLFTCWASWNINF